MTGIDIFNIVVGILGIISFVFAIWVWLKSDTKIRELSGIIDTVYDIAGTAMLEFQTTVTEDYEAKLRQVEKMLGFIMSIRKLAQRYAKQESQFAKNAALPLLIEQGIVWTKANVLNFENSKEITEVWLITPDLKPDSSDPVTGKLVSQNIKKGKTYTYFYPDDVPHVDMEIARLFQNILADDHSQKLKSKIRLVPLSRTQYSELFARGNIILYFRDQQRNLPPKCLEEIVLTQVADRPILWQEHSETKSKELRHLLETEIQKAKIP